MAELRSDLTGLLTYLETKTDHVKVIILMKSPITFKVMILYAEVHLVRMHSIYWFQGSTSLHHYILCPTPVHNIILDGWTKCLVTKPLLKDIGDLFCWNRLLKNKTTIRYPEVEKVGGMCFVRLFVCFGGIPTVSNTEHYQFSPTLNFSHLPRLRMGIFAVKTCNGEGGCQPRQEIFTPCG